MSGSELAKRCKAPRVALDRNDAARSCREQSPRQTARTCPYLDDCRMVEPSCRAGDPAREI